MTAQLGWLEATDTAGKLLLTAGGRWDIENAGALDARLHRYADTASVDVELDISAVDILDTAGAWLLYRTIDALRAKGLAVKVSGERPKTAAMLQQVSESYQPCETSPPRQNSLVRLVEELGAATLRVVELAADFVTFFGRSIVVFMRTVLNPSRLRFTSMVFHMEQVGFNAIPIVALISFLIGVVIAYQGAIQLEQFGAQVFVVDLIAVSVLRELGVLLTAIVIAGRSGSAFTAELGTMKVNEEVDALRTLGLEPIEVLVLPRALALIVTLPLLTFFADLMGLLGGAMMAWITLDVTPSVFLDRLKDAVSLWSFWVGIIKAPVFALLIALVGCYEGMQVSGSAESVGQHTTRSVVESIFLVIVVDALFSIFFGVVGI
ncbi:MAG: MlaE family lipid ABC transporter permease subunit [Gammaproteobacteria bacterium]|nr:MlaE family lipid ABC transporter permease subunit [Gammaproteobacteria bacterium]